jgi:hypothetical protein
MSFSSSGTSVSFQIRGRQQVDAPCRTIRGLTLLTEHMAGLQDLYEGKNSFNMEFLLEEMER